ncbi:MAG: TraR/DksA family transcriptional regulator [Chitinophagaceae bacterium]|nr:MAG: TraR/DksA family transcriptional regulator [Chitinophagaceae bacterium]
MAIKKKQAPKKAAKPAPKAAPKKTVAKKTVKKTAPAKPAPKAAAKQPVKASKPAPAKKPVAKPAPKAAPAKAVKAEAVKKPTPAPVSKPAAKAAPAKPEVKAAPAPVAAAPAPPVKAAPKKGGFDPQSLVTIKPTAKPVVKKEPPKPMKVVIPKTTAKGNVKYEPEFTKSVLDTPMYEYSGPTMRYSDSDLTEFKEIINKKLDAAKKELAYLQGLITRRDEGGDVDEARYMTMEDGSVSMEREQLSQMASRQITFIDHLEKAIMRIENKTYGVCRVTGKLIDKARLRAVPHATLSIEAKQMMNK